VAKKHATSEPDDLVSVVGAMIFASDEPVHPKEISSALGGLERQQIEEAIGTLQKRLERHGFGLALERIAGGVRFATRPELAPWLRQFFQQRNQTRLSLAALETLAIVAYRQPVTAPEIQAIRGKDPGAALKGLLDKKLVRCLGRKKVVGSPLLYGTEKEFLMHFGLDNLDDLPSIEDFDQFVELLDARLETPPASAGETLPESPPAGAVPEPPGPSGI